MSLKFTLRRNQRQMTTITAKHHVGGYEMLRILARFQTSGLTDVDGPDWDTDRPGDDISKSAVEHIIRGAALSRHHRQRLHQPRAGATRRVPQKPGRAGMTSGVQVSVDLLADVIDGFERIGCQFGFCNARRWSPKT